MLENKNVKKLVRDISKNKKAMSNSLFLVNFKICAYNILGDIVNCIVCHKSFIIKRSIKELLKKQMYLICDMCYKAHPLKLNVLNIPLEGGYEAFILSLFDESEKFNADGYILEYSKIVCKYLNKEPIVENNFSLNKKNIKRLDTISKLLQNNVYVICNRCKIM